ncbi:MAG: NAD-dependent epimerase/dehydratase family protein [Planctomycetaceae bacterium]|nr:NAD-dependent epimerase/dehydratase family protein [Planctomycetaceae bacterium]
MEKTTASRPCRVGFLGTGYIADWHARALRNVPGVTLESVCDKNLPRAEAFARRQGVSRSYGSLEAMLSDEAARLNVVHVLLPPDVHGRAAETLINRGVSVLLEKPMATTPAECSGLIQQKNSHNVSVGVNHNFLFAPVYENLRDDLASGRLGRPDHIVITWNRGLDQLQSGPYHLWMLRDPRNIVLEIGPHCLAPMLDLVGPMEIASVRASNAIQLPGGVPFYRRWCIEAGTGTVAVTIHLSFAPGFTEQFIHIRGSLASATADLERNTYLRHEHTPNGLDVDRFKMIRREARSMAVQARRTLSQCVLSKLKLGPEGSPYGIGIARALKAFYAGLGTPPDRRLAPELGRDLVDLCLVIGQMGLGKPPETAVRCAAREQAVGTPLLEHNRDTSAEILILGGTGFIGQELARQFVAQGKRIRLLVRDPGRLPQDLICPQVEIVTGDLLRADDLQRAIAGSRFVYHLARANVTSWSEFTSQDIEVTRQIGELCLCNEVKRLFYTGTIDSYYAGASAGTITEATPLDPQIAWRNLYARAKAASEQILVTMHRERGLPVVIFRPGIVIGRGASPLHWGIGMWSWNAVCQVWGQGRNPLPLVLVEDVARGLTAALDAPGIEGESFNLVAPTDLTAMDYLAALEKAAGISFQKIPTPPWRFYTADMAKWVVKQIIRHRDERRPSYRDWETRTQRARFDCTKARKVLNWNPACEREEIIRRGLGIPAAEFFK